MMKKADWEKDDIGETSESDYEIPPVGLGCALEMFTEKDEVIKILHSLPNIFQNDKKMETNYETYTKILDRYQEQPHLLDAQIENLVSICVDTFRSTSSVPHLPLRHLSLKYLRHIFKVRGRKEVVKRMPHEISELVPVLSFLESMDLEDATIWESSYVLLLWLSILVMNPFSLKLLDGSSDGESVSQRIMNLCYKAVVLNSNTLITEAARTLIANFLTRPDMQEIYMKSFVTWATIGLRETSEIGLRLGAFGSLAVLFKHAKREEILQYAHRVLEAVNYSSFEKADTKIRKLGTKLIQRIGQIFLKTKVAAWRYQRGCRSLLHNLQGSIPDTNVVNSNKSDNLKEDPNEYADLRQYSAQIEIVLDKLLTLLKDKDTVVRWSAAKGIGRITNRLPKEYGDEVVESVLAGFSDRETSATWHGSCLALAELSRRGLLLPPRLQATIAVIKKALFYDEIRGNFTVGSHVRDAACYVFWAFARAFDPSILAPYVLQLAPSLVNTMLFDREINCRRAASAAFQENVGRQGNFPHGIEIVTLADFFHIGNKGSSYVTISIEIGQFQEYVHPMIDHLLALKFNHVDMEIRELTAMTLGRFVDLDLDYVRKIMFSKLLPVAWHTHMPTAHGAILSISAIMLRLHQLEKLNLTDEEVAQIRNITINIHRKQFRESPTGHVQVREAITKFIKTCSNIKFPIHSDREVIEIWHSTLEDHIVAIPNDLRHSACETFPLFLEEYFYADPFKRGEVKRLVDLFTENLSSHSYYVRLGHLTLMGKLPPHILRDSFTQTFAQLCKCTKVLDKADKNWADTRKEAMVSIGCILSRGLLPDSVAEADWKKGIPLAAIDVEDLFKVLTEAMNDYTLTEKGDVGSWVRTAAMDVMKIFIFALRDCGENKGKKYLKPELLTSIMELILKQSMEKIDNIRARAIRIFHELVHSDPPIETLPFREHLLDMFPKSKLAKLNWRSPLEAFPPILPLLAYPEFTKGILCGLVISGGRIGHGGSVSLTSYLDGLSNEERAKELKRISDIFLILFKENIKKEHITIPMMQFLAQLFQSGILSPLIMNEPAEFGIELIQLIKTEVLRSNRMEKLLATVELLSELIQGVPSVSKPALAKLVMYLIHVYPRIRSLTAAKLYEAIITYEEAFLEAPDLQAGMALLSETQWTNSRDEVRPIRNKVCAFLNIPIPPTRSNENLHMDS